MLHAGSRGAPSGRTGADCSERGNVCRTTVSLGGDGVDARDPRAQILSAYIAKEELRILLLCEGRGRRIDGEWDGLEQTSMLVFHPAGRGFCLLTVPAYAYA